MRAQNGVCGFKGWTDPHFRRLETLVRAQRGFRVDLQQMFTWTSCLCVWCFLMDSCPSPDLLPDPLEDVSPP